ncbi:MAG: NAD(P)H-binding protein [Planctomycetes bacterium]|nr:NAD(P)H-binding protein [Planctomycetota bacterium]
MDTELAVLPSKRLRLAAGARVAVTGAGGYSGRVLTRALLDAGIRVVNLTGAPDRPTPFGAQPTPFAAQPAPSSAQVESRAFAWDRPGELERSLAGCEVLFNTYWIRFPRGAATHELAVRRSGQLFDAARRAGVRRIVHTSIAKPDLGSSLSYYRGKAEVERALRASGVGHAILRPTVLFGDGDVLLNNIAWCVRRFPLFLVPGDGRYRVQPLHVADFASALARAAEEDGDFTADAVGEETYEFRELVRTVARSLGRRVAVIGAPQAVVRAATAVLGTCVADVMLTSHEIEGLCAGLLATDAPPVGSRRLSTWLVAHADELGVRYANEVARHYER